MFIFLLAVEVMIALYIHDRIIRPYVGDYLVVILIYYFCKTFLNVRPLPLALGVLLFSYAVEVAQLLKVVEILGLQDNKLARIVIGVSFEWLDLLAYTLGIITVIAIEHFVHKNLEEKANEGR